MCRVTRSRMLKQLQVSELRARKPPGKWQVGHRTAARAWTEVFSALRADALRCWTGVWFGARRSAWWAGTVKDATEKLVKVQNIRCGGSRRRGIRRVDGFSSSASRTAGVAHRCLWPWQFPGELRRRIADHQDGLRRG